MDVQNEIKKLREQTGMNRPGSEKRTGRAGAGQTGQERSSLTKMDKKWI